MKARLLTFAVLGFSVAACSGTDPTPSAMGGTVSAAGTNAVGGGGVGGTAGAGGNVGGGGAASGGGGTGGVAGGAGGGGGAGGVFNPMPTKLSETGLFTDMKAQTLAPGVYAFEPAYKLWSDGATKHRWVYMPPGGKITTDSMEYWQYPAGFKLWKDFTRDGKLIETRLLLKKSDGLTDWYMVAFKWNADYSDAIALPEGEMNAMGTMHDIPNKDACTGCHGAMNDNALGFTALQLSHNIPGSLTLAQATQMGWFTAPPAVPPVLPGTDTEKAALGYLHANCGMCHNDHSKVYSTKSSLDLWTHLDAVDSVQKTRAYLSMVCDQWPALMGATPTQCDPGHATGAPMNTDISKAKRVVPGDPAMSGIHDLMALRATGNTQRQMPPLGTEIIDPTGMASVDAWITGLPH